MGEAGAESRGQTGLLGAEAEGCAQHLAEGCAQALDLHVLALSQGPR